MKKLLIRQSLPKSPKMAKSGVIIMGVIFFVGRIFLTILLLGMDETQWKESTKGSPFEGISALTLAIMAGIGALTDIILVIGKVIYPRPSTI